MLKAGYWESPALHSSRCLAALGACTYISNPWAALDCRAPKPSPGGPQGRSDSAIEEVVVGIQPVLFREGLGACGHQPNAGSKLQHASPLVAMILSLRRVLPAWHCMLSVCQPAGMGSY